MDNKKVKLAKAPIYKLYLDYLVPSIVSLLVMALYGIIDGIFIGRGIGKDALAALNIGYPIINFANALSLMFGVGGSTLISIYTKSKKFKNICFTYIILLNLISYFIILSIVFILNSRLMYFMGTSDSLLFLVKSYLYPTALGIIFIMLATSLTSVVRNNGSPVYAFVSMVIGAVVNIFLDWLFIFKFDFGMSGAAIATVIGQFSSFLLLFIYFYRRRNEITILLKKINFLLLSRIVSLGFSSFIVEFAVALITVLFNVVLINYGGEIAVSAFSIIGYIFYIFRMLYSGIAQGIQPIISYNFGLGNKDRLLEGFRLAYKISLLLSFTNIILINIFAKDLILLFNKDPDLLKITEIGLRLYSLTILFIGSNLINISYLQSKNLAKESIIISLLRSVLFILMYIVILPKFFGLYGIWLTFPLADGTTLLLTWIFRKRIPFFS